MSSVEVCRRLVNILLFINRKIISLTLKREIDCSNYLSNFVYFAMLVFLSLWKGEDGRNLKLSGNVGFVSLPDQLVNKRVNSGFYFNILCVGRLHLKVYVPVWIFIGACMFFSAINLLHSVTFPANGQSILLIYFTILRIFNAMFVIFPKFNCLFIPCIIVFIPGKEINGS